MLDRSGNYLKIFVDSFDIDYSLPKYNEALDEIRKDLVQDILHGGMNYQNLTAEEIEDKLLNDPDSLWNSISATTPDEFNTTVNKMDSIMERYKVKKARETAITISSDRFDKLNSKDLLVLSENTSVVNRIRSSSGDINRLILDNDTLISNYAYASGGGSKWSKLKGKIKDYLQKKKDQKKEASLIDPLEFFRTVKLTTEESKKLYVDRSQPYLLAIERANTMGQKALVDQLLSGMFIAKYESILRAEGYDKSITESQLVEFVKKTKKGIQLSYIKNFARNIPLDVIEKKKKVDGLYVFDNYCVLYYDPTNKSYSQTTQEREKERQRKADPILFGMLAGSRKLYYIADWVDEYCDLTLEEFLKASGLTEKDIEIETTIKV